MGVHWFLIWGNILVFLKESVFLFILIVAHFAEGITVAPSPAHDKDRSCSSQGVLQAAGKAKCPAAVFWTERLTEGGERREGEGKQSRENRQAEGEREANFRGYSIGKYQF